MTEWGQFYTMVQNAAKAMEEAHAEIHNLKRKLYERTKELVATRNTIDVVTNERDELKELADELTRAKAALEVNHEDLRQRYNAAVVK